jgi:hypothetical protein
MKTQERMTMKNIEAVVCSGCTKEVTDGRFVESEDLGELVSYGCVEAAYQVYLAATDEDINEALLRMYLN